MFSFFLSLSFYHLCFPTVTQSLADPLGDMETLSREQKYAQMRESLNEKQWRQYIAMEAKERGNIAEVAREAKVSTNTIRRGIREIEAEDAYKEGERIRKEGGGRKPLLQTDETLLEDLEGLLQ